MWNWEKDRILETNFNREPKIDIRGPFNLNSLTFASKIEVITRFKLCPRGGKWHSWMDNEWEAAWEVSSRKEDNTPKIKLFKLDNGSMEGRIEAYTITKVIRFQRIPSIEAIRKGEQRPVLWLGTFEGMVGTWIKNDRQARSRLRHSVTGQRIRAEEWAEVLDYGVTKVPGQFIPSSGENPSFTVDDLDLYMSPGQRERPFEERYRPFLLGFDAEKLLLSDGDQASWDQERIQKTNFEHETKIDIRGPLNLNHLTLTSKVEIILRFNLNPRGTWYAWMDEEWEQAFELLGLRKNEKVSSALAGGRISFS